MVIGHCRSLPSPRVFEVGCGSGAVSIALLTSLPKATVTAIDIDPAAVELTNRNAIKYGAVM